MNNFTFCTPTKVIFGKDIEKQIGETIKGYGASRVLIHYGGGSVKKTGLFDKVVNSLESATQRSTVRAWRR